ncbi:MULTISPECIES: 5-formyltetrahydrofolate cyclo-ligase [Psychromonas]|uniref:5-formyltetrahydrofolate cyclo-ligase n=1 Tax=Psychromonas TaxID=67572 RepID=UPI0003FF4F1A|nr:MULTISPECIES: 5-formyltetrahydrofolate cyclo-ligase [Psychromonas]MBB1272606.1 5-formyltetrahydrofolate cyclo-ligase [Psychromonas sp. SR45-3]
MTNTISTQRNTIRQQVRSARKALSRNEQQQASCRLLQTLKQHPKVQQAQHVSVTLAYDGEIDLSPFIDWCWQQQKQVYLPVVHPTKTGQLLFLAYQKNTEMIINRYGIAEPKLTHATKNIKQTCPADALDLVLTPLVAFDQQGNRIGMGGGYYDRLLAPWFTQRTGPYPIGLAHDCQYINALPIQEWDVPLPEVITPSQHFYFE